jgi:hypothetical protein
MCSGRRVASSQQYNKERNANCGATIDAFIVKLFKGHDIVSEIP